MAEHSARLMVNARPSEPSPYTSRLSSPPVDEFNGDEEEEEEEDDERCTPAALDDGEVD